jgi:signal transduction histidine kinase
MAHYETRSTLERELSLRLMAVARAISATLRPSELQFLEPGDEKTRIYRSLLRRLEKLRKATGLRRVYVFDGKLRSLADTTSGIPIGKKYYHLEVERRVIGRVTAKGQGSSLLYRGKDGKLYKTGYAALKDAEGKLVAVVAAEGSAAQFALLSALSRRLYFFAGAGAALLILLSFLLARMLVKPLRRLAGAAETIGEGRLDEPVPAVGTAEVGQVAASMERMRLDLRKRDEQMRMMLAGIAHEVRNPLGGMELITGMLREELADRPEPLEQVERITRELDYLKRVVEEFLEYARWTPSADQQPCELSDVASEVVELLTGEALMTEVKLSGPAARTSVRAECDPDAMRRALINLVRNAVQSTPAGGTVTVAVHRQDGPDGRATTRLTVGDTGEGVPEDQVDKVFEPFYTTKQRGTGLGLALVRKVAEAHGGTVWVEPGDGGGAAFVMELPASEGGSESRVQDSENKAE